MPKERFGPWEEISEHPECGYRIAKEVKWMNRFFVPVCPKCGASNDGLLGIFKAVTARRVTNRWGRYLRTEVLGEGAE